MNPDIWTYMSLIRHVMIKSQARPLIMAPSRTDCTKLIAVRARVMCAATPNKQWVCRSQQSCPVFASLSSHLAQA